MYALLYIKGDDLSSATAQTLKPSIQRTAFDAR